MDYSSLKLLTQGVLYDLIQELHAHTKVNCAHSMQYLPSNYNLTVN